MQWVVLNHPTHVFLLVCAGFFAVSICFVFVCSVCCRAACSIYCFHSETWLQASFNRSYNGTIANTIWLIDFSLTGLSSVSKRKSMYNCLWCGALLFSFGCIHCARRLKSNVCTRHGTFIYQQCPLDEKGCGHHSLDHKIWPIKKKIRVPTTNHHILTETILCSTSSPLGTSNIKKGLQL